MKKLFLCLMALFTLASFSGQAHAGKLMFGEDTNIKRIEASELKGPEGEELYIAYKTTTFFAGLGVYITDDGYVLGIKGNHGAYYDFPEGDKLQALQEAGIIPDPLPEYKIELFDYAFGFSLWILLGFAILQVVIKSRFSKKGQAPTA